MGRPSQEKQVWFLFAHGAGAPSTSAWMVNYSDQLAEIAPVVTFDYNYMLQGKKRPDPHAHLLAAHREALRKGQKRFPKRRPVLIGKSMGGRIGCHLALEEEVLGCICLGFPLKGMGENAKLRDQVLLDLSVPILLVQGTRDSLCPLGLLQDVLAKRKARSELHIVESGNHSLEPTKSFLKQSAQSERDLQQATLDTIRHFVRSLG